MRLSDIMGRMGLSSWAEIALLMFFALFMGISIYVFAVRKRSRWERARYLPLDGGPPDDVPPEDGTDGTGELGSGGDEPPKD